MARTLRFYLNMEKALFDWPIVLQYDVKAKYRLIFRKFSGMIFFHSSVKGGGGGGGGRSPRATPLNPPLYTATEVIEANFKTVYLIRA